MFGLSVTEILVIAILALVVFGPDRIPGIARTIGKTLRDMRKAASDVQRAFEVEEIRRELKAKNTGTRPSAPALPSANATTPGSSSTPASASASAPAVAQPPLSSSPPDLPQLRAPIQSVPALATFSALRDAVDAPDPLDDLTDDDAQADADDAALSARLKGYLRSFVVVTVPLVGGVPQASHVLAVGLPERAPHLPPVLVSLPLPGSAA